MVLVEFTKEDEYRAELKKRIKEQYKSQARYAEEIGMSQAYVCDRVNGHGDLNKMFLAINEKLLGVSLVEDLGPIRRVAGRPGSYFFPLYKKDLLHETSSIDIPAEHFLKIAKPGVNIQFVLSPNSADEEAKYHCSHQVFMNVKERRVQCYTEAK